MRVTCRCLRRSLTPRGSSTLNPGGQALAPDRSRSRARGPGLAASMAPPLLPLLLLACVVTVQGVDLTYTPQITTQPIQGKLTSTTFALEVPTCVFTEYPLDAIWLVVSLVSATGNVPKPITGIAPYSQFSTRGYYMTLRTYGRDFDCPAPVGEVHFVRVGANTTCVGDTSIQDCNGPLPAYTSVRVMFVGINASNVETVRTRWSEVITLPTATQPSTIDTWPGGRSGGMIVITTILSVLVAILLACLIGLIVAGGKNICWRKQLSNQEYVDPVEDEHKRYSSHHVPQHFPQQFQQQQIPTHI